MMHFPDALLDAWLDEDSPYGDLTTECLRLGDQPARLEAHVRGATVCACTEEAGRLVERCDGRVALCAVSGTALDDGKILLRAEGPARGLFRAWKPVQNLLEYACGIASHTRTVLNVARAARPHVQLLATRKSPPGMKKIVVKAITAGGAQMHRLGTSETFLAFPQHMAFCGGAEGLSGLLPGLRDSLVEKSLAAEVGDLGQALLVAKAGANLLQFDKQPAAVLARWVAQLRGEYPHLRLLAAGGIRLDNVAEYAATGVDGLVLSSLYQAPPADIGIRLCPADD